MEITDYIEFLEDVTETLHGVDYKIDDCGTICLNEENYKKIKGQYELETEEDERKFEQAFNEVCIELMYLEDERAFYDYYNDEYSNIMNDIVTDYYRKEYGHTLIAPWEEVDLDTILDEQYIPYYYVGLRYRVIDDESYNELETIASEFRWLA